MKNETLKPILFCVFFLLLLVVLVENNPLSSSMFKKSEKANEKVIELTKENEGKELIAKKVYNQKFIYLAFQNGDDFVSYIIDSDSGEVKDFSYCIKDGKQEEFENKIKELLYLKYPKFIADVLSGSDVTKTYQIRENELVIHYTNTNIEMDEHLFLRVNYNEIKDYLDYTFLLDYEYENEDGYHYDKNKKTIAFSFDDGPSGEKTNQIVQALHENKAHATFFMVGNKMEIGKNTIQNVLNNGNEIGSHSYAHKNMKRQKLNDIISSEVMTHEIYKNITGKDLIYTRPPYGSINNEIKENLNTIFITWNVDTEDWLHRDKNYIVDYVMNNVNDGDIILMHDSYNSTVEAVKELLPKLYKEGYQVVSVSELAQLKGKTLETHSLYRSIKKD